ncbi:MAG: polysaccharide biosynthesis C-terminal domain-containing protein [Anaerolineaceae bacterium]
MSIAYGGIIAFLFRGMNLVIALTTVVLTSRVLSSADYGLFGLALSVVGFVSAMTGGLAAATAYQISNQRRQAAVVVLNSGTLALALGALAVAAGMLVGSMLSGEVSRVALAVAISAAALIANSVIAGMFLGRESFIRYNLTLVGPPLAALAAIAVTFFLLDRQTPEAALGAYATGQGLSLGAMLLLGRSSLSGGVRFEGSLARSVLRFTLLAGISSGISFLNYRADLFIVDYFEGKVGVGPYLLAVYIAESVWQVSGSLALATYARVGSLSRPEAAQLTARVMRHTVVLLGAVCAMLFIAADVIEAALGGEKYAGVASALRYLLPGVLVYGLAQSFSGFYTYQRGLPWVAALVAGTGLLLDIALAIILVPRMGIDGAALASAIAYSTAITAGLVVFVRREHLAAQQVFRFGRAEFEDYRGLFDRLRSVVVR